MNVRRSNNPWATPGAALSWIALISTVTWGGACGAGRGAAPEDNSAETVSQEAAADIEKFCSACHAWPSPESFPKEAWYDETRQGFNFYWESGRRDLEIPDFSEAVKYFRGRAPSQLELSEPAPAASAFGRQFRCEEFSDASAAEMPAIAQVRALAFGPGERLNLVLCDMWTGVVAACPPQAGSELTRLAALDNPCHAEPCDLDGDGRLDLMVADLGSFDPGDHRRGRVIWLRQLDNRSWAKIVLAEGLGRVADVRPADFDGDGDLDLVVAEFGWRKTGRILLLSQGAQEGAVPTFELSVVDERHGTIHVPVVDLNNDGRPDFVALISQEHEVVDAFINRGDNRFEIQRIFTGPDPAYGSSGIELVDLDADGDFDILYTNGDTYDSPYIKPSHGVAWLENQGTYPFLSHRLADIPGAYRALAADLDQDGDLDVVVAALVPRRAKPAGLRERLDALICLEQTRPGVFVRHSLARGDPRFPALDLADLDGDGDVDILAGSSKETTSGSQRRFSIWWNEPAREARGIGR